MSYIGFLLNAITYDFIDNSGDSINISNLNSTGELDFHYPGSQNLLETLNNQNLVIPFSMDVKNLPNDPRDIDSSLIFDYIENNYSKVKESIFDPLIILNLDAVNYYLDAIKLIEKKMYRPAILSLFATIDAVIASVDITGRTKPLGSKLLQSPPQNEHINIQMLSTLQTLNKCYQNGDGKYDISEIKDLPRRNLYMHGMATLSPTLRECYLLLAILSNLTRVAIYYITEVEHPNFKFTVKQ